MITVSITRNSSKANWSCRKTPSFLGRVTEPFEGSSSPVRTFISVDFPAPFGPEMAYRRPARNVQETSSNRSLAPKRMDRLLMESKDTSILPQTPAHALRGLPPAQALVYENFPEHCQVNR